MVAAVAVVIEVTDQAGQDQQVTAEELDLPALGQQQLEQLTQAAAVEAQVGPVIQLDLLQQEDRE